MAVTIAIVNRLASFQEEWLGGKLKVCPIYLL
jgi:hypothetical protein